MEILEQQELMKNLQKNFFFYTHQTLMQMEGNAVLQALNSCSQNPADINKAVKGLVVTIPEGMNGEQKQAVENMLKQFNAANQNRNYDQFWSIYNKEKKISLWRSTEGLLIDILLCKLESP